MCIERRLFSGAGLIEIERSVTNDKPAERRSDAGAAQPPSLLLPDHGSLQMRFAQPVETARIKIVIAHENLRGLQCRCIVVSLIARHLPLQVERKEVRLSPGQEMQLVPNTQETVVSRGHRPHIGLWNSSGFDQATESRTAVGNP